MAAAPSAAEPAVAQPCRDAARFDCHHVEVPLDRDNASAGSIRLHVRTLAGQDDAAPLLAIAGGPGQSAVALSDTFEVMARRAAPGRGLVLLDQRGTGRSGLLRCRALERDPVVTSRAAARCAQELGPRRAHYTTRDSVGDIEAVRVALGMERLALLGISYGSRVALAYAAAHPEHVERIVLDSPVPLAGPDALMRSTLRATPRVLRAGCAQRCRNRGWRPARDMARLVSRLRSARHGARRRAGLLRLLLDGEFDPALRRGLPQAVHRALRGDWTLLRQLHRRARLTVRGPFDPFEFSAALNATVVCEEVALPWLRAAAHRARMRAVRRTTARLSARSLFPFDRTTIRRSDVIRQCARWPHALPPPAPVTPPAVPALVLAGGRDLLTPRADSRRLARRLENARLVTDARAGHSVLSRRRAGSCATRAVRAFMAGEQTGTRRC